ncbi:hypothetical protein [Acinetobacter rudis]|uniref:Uncharacterized protein n=1 Tax=Acinetobacter rudis CIP 110305 TaxID=421052 RepID=S3N257_9GAMM|nr:hypothetical protein [Acinetobacter rudis]EPF73807.1 hypothetical protein F945_01966 [Acinetobacter rudis CIP 110305]
MAYLLALKMDGVCIVKYIVVLATMLLITACSETKQSEVITDTTKQDEVIAYTTEGWSSQKTPTGYGLSCTTCENQVMVSIDVVPVDKSNKYTQSNSDFINYLMSDKDIVSKKMASDVIPNAKVEMLKSGKAKIGDKEVFRYAFVVNDGVNDSFDNTSLLIHNDNLIKITLNYYDGYFSEKDRKMVDSLYNSIKFN